MGDYQQQLADLRRRVAHISSKYESGGSKYESREPPPLTPPLPRPAFAYVQEWLTGEEIETQYGRHFETEKLYEGHRRHGSADVGALAALPSDLLDTLSGGAFPAAPPAEW